MLCPLQELLFLAGIWIKSATKYHLSFEKYHGVFILDLCLKMNELYKFSAFPIMKTAFLWSNTWLQVYMIPCVKYCRNVDLTCVFDKWIISVVGNDITLTLTLWLARWRLKSPASRLFTEPFVQEQIKENIKAPHQWPLLGEIHRWLKFCVLEIGGYTYC